MHCSPPRRAASRSNACSPAATTTSSVTAPPTAAPALAAIAHDRALALTRIGWITGERGLAISDERGDALLTIPRAFDHFADPSP